MSVTPSLPQRGRHPKGSVPLDPQYSSHIFGFFTNFLWIYYNLRMQCGGGRESGYPGFQRVPRIKNNNFYKSYKIIFSSLTFFTRQKKL